MKKILAIVLISTSTLMLTGCAPKIGGHDYNASDAGTAQHTAAGVIVSVQVVDIHGKQPNEPGIGAAAGGVAAGVLGHTLFHGKTRTLATVASAAGGAVAGHYAEQALTHQEGFRYQVQLDQGGIVTVVQGAEPRLSRGQRVYVTMGSKGASRVIPQ